MAKEGIFVQNDKTAKLSYDIKDGKVHIWSFDAQGYDFLSVINDLEKITLKQSYGDLSLLIDYSSVFDGQIKCVATIQ